MIIAWKTNDEKWFMGSINDGIFTNQIFPTLQRDLKPLTQDELNKVWQQTEQQKKELKKINTDQAIEQIKKKRWWHK